MHLIRPDEGYAVVTLRVAVPMFDNGHDDAWVYDSINEWLNNLLADNPNDPPIVDWSIEQLNFVHSSADPEEGELFASADRQENDE